MKNAKSGPEASEGNSVSTTAGRICTEQPEQVNCQPAWGGIVKVAGWSQL